MQNTIGIYKDRKDEIEFYYSIMIEINGKSGKIKTKDNRRFFKIMKSNFLLMLYNLVESCIVNGMTEIYEGLKNDVCSYNDVISEIQSIWSKSQISRVYGQATKKSTYENKIEYIIKTITKNEPIILSKDSLNKAGGNLNAKTIIDICDSHKIRYKLETKGESLERVKLERNKLAHGVVSFSDCARELTLGDLKNIRDEIVIFLDNILLGMKTYYQGKLYKK